MYHVRRITITKVMWMNRLNTAWYRGKTFWKNILTSYIGLLHTFLKIFLRQKCKITITKVMWMGSLNSLQNTLLNNNMYVESLSQKWCEWTGWIQKWIQGWIQLDTGEKHSGKISLHLTLVCCVQFWKKKTWRTLSSRCYKHYKYNMYHVCRITITKVMWMNRLNTAWYRCNILQMQHLTSVCCIQFWKKKLDPLWVQDIIRTYECKIM